MVRNGRVIVRGQVSQIEVLGPDIPMEGHLRGGLRAPSFPRRPYERFDAPDRLTWPMGAVLGDIGSAAMVRFREQPKSPGEMRTSRACRSYGPGQFLSRLDDMDGRIRHEAEGPLKPDSTLP